MSLLRLSIRNALRNRLRSILTVLAIAVSLVVFVFLRTVIGAWTTAAEHAQQDRIGTRHKVALVMPLPKRYIDTIRQVEGVKAATWANWFGAKDPKNTKEFFASLAVDTDSYFAVYDEMKVPAEQLAAWKADRIGIIIGEGLAKQKGWKLGDRVTLTGSIYPGDWQFCVRGIYHATKQSVDRMKLIMHWQYLNESLPERSRDEIGWIVSRIADSHQTAAISGRIDLIFDQKDVQTLSMSEQAMNQSFLGMMSAIMDVIGVVSLIILGVMLLILANTITMGVRERTHEYGVMRAVGFLPKHIAIVILTEGLGVGLLSSAVGLSFSYGLISVAGRGIEENLGTYFPHFHIDGTTSAAAVALPLLLGAAAALLPALQMARLRVVDSLREIG